jgi:periplasmic mercuric ion binding protein
MKTQKSFFISMFVMAFLFASVNVMCQSKSKFVQVEIKTTAQCGMCKDRIEGAFAYEKGVKKSELNLTNKVVTVTYDPNKTTPDKLRQMLSNLGYDADGVLADPVAYKALPKCCQKPANGDTK